MSTLGFNGNFMMVLDSQGNLINLTGIENKGGSANINSILSDAESNIYCTGSFSGGTIDLDPSIDSLYISTANTIAESDIFIGKYTQNGELIWGNSFGSDNQGVYDNGKGILKDNLDNIYAVGEFATLVDFNQWGPNLVLDPINGSGYLLKFGEINASIHNNETSDFIIYPNPTKGRIIVKIDNTNNVEIYNLRGELIQVGISNSTIDLSIYPAGVYLLNIGGTTYKLILSE